MEGVRILADATGQRVALVEPGRVLLLDLPGFVAAAELGIAGELEDHDVSFVGEAGRLAVMTRSGGRAVLHLVDPAGPTKLGEVQFRTTARLLASAGNYVLTIAGNVAAVTDVSAPAPVAIPLPTRGVITAAAPIGPQRFAIAIGGAIEEWDAGTRTPGRRLRLDRAVTPIALGGNAQRLFIVARDAPDLVEVVTLGTRSTRKLELPEPALRVAAHPSGDLLAVLGASTRSVYLLDLVRGTPVRLDRGAITDTVWIGGGHALAIKPDGGPLELIAVENTVDPGRRPALGPELVAAVAPADEATRVGEPDQADPPADAEAASAGTSTLEDSSPPTQWSRQEISHRLAAWRNRFGGSAAAPTDPDPGDASAPDPVVAARGGATAAAERGSDRAPGHAEPTDRPTDPRARAVTGVSAARPARTLAATASHDRDSALARAAAAEASLGSPRDPGDHDDGHAFDHDDPVGPHHDPSGPHHELVAPAHGRSELPHRGERTERIERIAAGHAGGWRGELATWARSVDAGSVRSAPNDPRLELDVVSARLGLSHDLALALALLYGAHLAGLRGIAPLELASVAGWRWEEALGAGALASAGITRWIGSRVRLAEETVAAIDGRPPCFGTAVEAPRGSPASAEGRGADAGDDLTASIAGTREAVALVAPPSVALPQVGAWAAAALGALLVPNERGERAPERFVLEARMRGLAPLVPWTRFRLALADPPHPGAIIVEHAATAADLDLPVVATWGGGAEQGGAASA